MRSNTANMKHLMRVCGLILLTTISQSNASWGSPGSGQYHIQTDEGPERYFRYLTDNGQYRKEKRLQDGTVIGTDAWIDASGFLRQKDYIADGGGYRILKSKTIYVGQGQAIEEALRSIKNLPSGSSSDNKLKLLHATTTTVRPLVNYISTTTARPLYYDHPSTPTVHIQPNSQPLDNRYVPVKGVQVKPTPIPAQAPLTVAPLRKKHPVPSVQFEPPYNNEYGPITADYTSSTPSPISSTQLPITTTNLLDPYPTHLSPLNTDLLPPLVSPTAIPNELYDYSPISSTTPRPTPISSTEASVIPLNSNNLEPQPLYTRPVTSRPYSSRNPFLRGHPNYNENVGSGYDPQYPEYDGVAVNDNGFRYYLPRQYHEEENSGGDRRAGSFGYIDPFGIRRVVYYNASPEQGFVHRKNNRYVGFDATPYDPRPL